MTAGLGPLTLASGESFTKLLPEQGIIDISKFSNHNTFGIWYPQIISCNHRLRMRGRVLARQQLKVNATAISQALPSFKEFCPTACRSSKPKSQIRIRMKRSQDPQKRPQEQGQSAGCCSHIYLMKNCAIVVQRALG